VKLTAVSGLDFRSFGVKILVELLIVWLGLFAVFTGSSGIFYVYLKHYSAKPWDLKMDKNFRPPLSILVPVHNEEEVIKAKLENIKEVSYPKENIEVIVADDVSQDKTLMKVKNFMENNPELNIRVVRQNRHAGKSAALNKALAISTNPIVIVSDADTQWSSDMLQKALHYLSDPKVGAVTGCGVIENKGQSWVTKGETDYLQLGSFLRLGESKIHSTIRFEGGFCAYKRDAFEKFDCESGSDDSGTALFVVQNGFRTIFVPEARFMTNFPEDLKGKIRVKKRRANHMMWLWIKSLKLLLKRRLLLPKKIAIPEIFFFIFNPVVFFALIGVTLITIIIYPVSLVPLIIVLSLASIVPKVKSYLIEITLGNIILFYSLVSCIRGKKIFSWNTA